jgi:hypothetical protein
MVVQSLNLPINIPWKLIAVSEDMLDTQFCDKELPLEWRSSLAISAFEPPAEALPEGFCEGQLTYLKVTCTQYRPKRMARSIDSRTDRLVDPKEIPELSQD